MASAHIAHIPEPGDDARRYPALAPGEDRALKLLFASKAAVPLACRAELLASEKPAPMGWFFKRQWEGTDDDQPRARSLSCTTVREVERCSFEVQYGDEFHRELTLDFELRGSKLAILECATVMRATRR